MKFIGLLGFTVLTLAMLGSGVNGIPAYVEVQLFEDYNFKGASRSLDVLEDCTPIFGLLEGQASSIDFENACIVVYKDGQCQGNGIEFNGITKDSRFRMRNNLNNFGLNDVVRAIKLCPGLPPALASG